MTRTYRLGEFSMPAEINHKITMPDPFKLTVAAAIALFGFQSVSALATVVGVLVEPCARALIRARSRCSYLLEGPGSATDAERAAHRKLARLFEPLRSSRRAA